MIVRASGSSSGLAYWLANKVRSHNAIQSTVRVVGVTKLKQNCICLVKCLHIWPRVNGH